VSELARRAVDRSKDLGETRSGWVRGALAVLAILALLGAFFSTPIARYRDSSYTAADLTQTATLLQIERGHPPKNQLLSDPVVEMQPWLLFNKAELAAGRMPLWNDYNASGIPHFATFQSAVLSLYSAPFYVLSFKAALLVSAFLKLFGLALFTYLFLRRYGLARVPSLIGAAAFTFCGHNVLLLAYPHAAAVIALPAGLYFAELALQRFEASRPTFPALAGLTLSLAVGLLAGQPEPFYFSALFVGVFCFARIAGLAWREWLDTGRPAPALWMGVRLSIAAAVAAGMGAVQLLPFLEYLSRSTVLDWRSHMQAPLGTVAWPLAFFPNLLGNPSLPYNIAYWLPPPNYEAANTSYIGALALCAFVVSIVFARRDRRVAFFALLAILWAAYAYNLLGASRVFALVPTLGIAPINRSQPFGAFAISATIALGVDHLLRVDRARWRPAAATALVGAAMFALFYWRGERLFLQARGYLKPFQRGIESYVPEHFLAIGLSFAIGIAALSSLWVLRAAWIRQTLALAVLAVIFFQSGWLLRDYNPTVEDRFVFPKTPAIAKLQRFVRDEPLVIFGNDTLPPHLNIAYGLRLLSSYDAMWVRKYDELYRDFFGRGGNWRSAVRIEERGMRVFGARFVLSPGTWCRAGSTNEEVLVSPKDLYTTGELLPGAPVVQTFIAQRDRLQGIALNFSVLGRKNTCHVRVRVEDALDGGVVAEKIYPAEDWVEDRFARRELLVHFEPVLHSRGRLYRVVVESDDASPGNAVTLWAREDVWYWDHWVGVQNTPVLPIETVVNRLTTTLRQPFGRLHVAGARRQGGLLADQSYNLDNYEAVRAVSGYTLAKIRDPLPRYYTVSRAIREISDSECFTIVRESEIDPRRLVVLSDGNAPLIDNATKAPGIPEPAVSVLSENSDRVRLRVERATAGYLVLARTHFPGWKATVNGRDAPVLRANYAFCAVELPAGECEIEFHYAPDSFYRGLAISIACPVVGALLALIAWLRGRRSATAI
jgi:hypothetical protein